MPEFLATERCDRCGAQAYVEMRSHAGFILLFCAHHFTEHRMAAMAKGLTVGRDTRNTLVSS